MSGALILPVPDRNDVTTGLATPGIEVAKPVVGLHSMIEKIARRYGAEELINETIEPPREIANGDRPGTAGRPTDGPTDGSEETTADSIMATGKFQGLPCIIVTWNDKEKKVALHFDNDHFLNWEFVRLVLDAGARNAQGRADDLKRIRFAQELQRQAAAFAEESALRQLLKN